MILLPQLETCDGGEKLLWLDDVLDASSPEEVVNVAAIAVEKLQGVGMSGFHRLADVDVPALASVP